MRRGGVLLLLVLAVAVSSAGAANAPTTTVWVVPAKLVFKNGRRPGKPGDCSAVVFGQWAHVPGTKSVTVAYRWNGKDRSVSGTPPFNDSYEWVAKYRAPAGVHWLKVSVSWATGPTSNDCSSMVATAKERYDPSAVAEITVSETADCRDAKKYRAMWEERLKRLETDKIALKAAQNLGKALTVGEMVVLAGIDRKIAVAKNNRTLWSSRVTRLCG